MRRLDFTYPDTRHLPPHAWVLIVVVATVLIAAVVR
jgi:hypothetical protein